jgi:hypothetical protein
VNNDSNGNSNKGDRNSFNSSTRSSRLPEAQSVISNWVEMDSEDEDYSEFGL